MLKPTIAAAIGVAWLAVAPALAATPPKPVPAAAAAVPRLDPESLAALNRMGAYLRTLQTFEVKADSTTEEVLGNGQKLQFLNRVRYVAQKPDKLFTSLRSDKRFVNIYYNGKKLTVFTPPTGYYAEGPASGTIGELLVKADEKYGIEFPLQDLFRWGDATSNAETPKEGFKVGPAQIGENTTDHYAFRQNGVDFQIWIDQGDKPLPRKLVITTLADPAQPQYVAYFTWNMAPKITSTTFDFVPGKTAVKIPLAGATAAPAK